jgi:ribosome-dependent ATPase
MDVSPGHSAPSDVRHTKSQRTNDEKFTASQFSGLLQPVSTLDGGARVFGTLWPTTYYMHASVGAFTKGLGADGLLMDALALAAFLPILIGLSVAGLPRQEH